MSIIFRMLVIGLFLCPFSATAATYQLTGDGTCRFNDGSDRTCTATATFDVDTFGQEVRIMPAPANRFTVRSGDETVFSDLIGWMEDIPDVCTDICAYATTDLEGNLTDFWFRSIYTPSTSSGDFTSWRIDFSDAPLAWGNGTWTVSAVPLPPSAALFGGALLLGLVIRYRTRRAA